MLHTRQLHDAGWTSEQIQAQLSAGRWRRTGWQTVATVTGPLTRESTWWWAVLEVGPRSVLAGVTALQVAGLSGLDEPTVHVASPKSSRPRLTAGVRIHETRRLRPHMLATTGLPRLRPVWAAVFAAMWAGSDRQAALFLVMPVQQRIVRASELARAAEELRRHPRVGLINGVAHDLVGGAHALGELDFARLCRQAGLPEPSRQRVLRSTAGGRYYLDVEWERWRVAVEIDGIAHLRADTWMDDAWRFNEVAMGGRLVLRFPQLSVRTEPERVLAQTRAALRSRGWPG